MDKDLVQGPFVAQVSIRDGIRLQREKGWIAFSAAEADRLVQLVLSAMGVESYPVLPSRLQTAPFECQFKASRWMELHRVGEHPDNVGVSFGFDEGDTVITIVRQAAAKFIDRTTIKGRSKAFHPSPMPDPPYDGR